MSDDKVINFDDAKSPFDHARKESKLKSMRARFKASRTDGKPKKKTSTKKGKKRKKKR